MKKINVEVKFKLVLNMDEDISLREVMDELDYYIFDTTEKAHVEDAYMDDYEVKDSR